MNEGLEVFRQLSPEQIGSRLRRCGIEADPDSIRGTAGKKTGGHSHTYVFGQDPASYRQRYRLHIYNLTVLECHSIGVGGAVTAASRESSRSGYNTGGSVAGYGHGNGRAEVADGSRLDDRGARGNVGQGDAGNGRVGDGARRDGSAGGVGDSGQGVAEAGVVGGRSEGGVGRVGDNGQGVRAGVVGDGGRVSGRVGDVGDNGQGVRAGVVGDGGRRNGVRAGSVSDKGHGVRAGVVGGGGRVSGRVGDVGDSGHEVRAGVVGGGGGRDEGAGDAGLSGHVDDWTNAALDGPRGAARVLHTIAIRALYSLGLDSGEVELRALGGRQYAVTGIRPLMAVPGKPLPEPYRSAAEALDRLLVREQAGRPGLLMGMDPEFILLRESTGRVVPASRYLPLSGIAGCDAGPPGTRGVFPVAELRPAPRGEPRALLAQLMSAARAADRQISTRSLRWRAGGMPLPGWALGGHLHFSGVALCAPLLRALDNYLALPMFLLEDVRAAARRPRYGVLGDFRLQPHGGFEYRTLPSFLVSPVIAKGAVYLAHLIVSHYEDLTLRPLDREDLHAAFYSGDKAPLREAWPLLEAQLRALSGYAAAASCIDPLLRLIAAQQTWDESRDIRALWRTGAPSVSAATTIPATIRKL